MGPTAVLKSLAKVNNFELSNGIVNNMTLDTKVFLDKTGLKKMVNLIRVLVDLKVYHIQFNMVSADTLRTAQKEPEKYKDLVVRVAGYSAYFTNISEDMQNEIIARTEHAL